MPEYRIGVHRGKFVLIHGEGRNRARISLGTDDRGKAEAVARDIWRARTAPVGDKVADIWNAYLAERLANGVKVDAAGSTWKALAPSFGHMIAPSITTQDARDHYRRRKLLGRSDSTIRTELELLRAALRFRYGTNAPRLWIPPQSAPRDRYLTKDDLNVLLESIETPHVRLFVILAVTTGARMGALLELTWDRVDLTRRTIDLNPAGRHKTNKRRAVVPINETALKALQDAVKGAMTDYVIEYDGKRVGSVRKAIRAAAARSGIPCSPHVFRHTAGVWMAEADVPMQKIAQYLGHTSTRVTESTYARYSPSFMRDAGAALEF